MAASYTQFKKGKSGNPKGRPKVFKVEQSAFSIIANKTLTIMQNGAAREMTAMEALQQKIYAKAISGNRGAQKEVLRMMMMREKARRRQSSGSRPRIEQVKYRIPDNAIAALMILGIAGPDETLSGSIGAPLLEIWAVEAAQARRRGARFSKSDIEAIRYATRDGRRLILRSEDSND